MKVIAENGERVVLEGGAHLGSTFAVCVQTPFGKIIEIQIVDGLISQVAEHVARRSEENPAWTNGKSK